MVGLLGAERALAVVGRVFAAGLALGLLGAGAAEALPADATYLLECTSGAPAQNGTLDASTRSVAGNLTDATPPSTFSCDAEVGVGDPDVIPLLGPYSEMSGAALAVALSLTNRVTYEWELTPSPDLTVDPSTLMVPLELIGLARARLTGGDFNFGDMEANIFSTFFTGSIQARMGTSGTCLSGQLGTVGGQATCVTLDKLTALVASGSVGHVQVTTNAGYSTNAASTFFAFADPVVQIDPVAEFAPGMRYADFFSLGFSPGVVNAVPEAALAPLLGLGLALLAARRHRAPSLA